ncbi:uncharacterized protein V1516DRAFT_681245 [Lipomyces oligophaga]|uniref:uncharacterized protein n=1 Tax=Lipomyces oligophaga TaxID=45792 RepID=UPI0034CF8D47
MLLLRQQHRKQCSPISCTCCVLCHLFTSSKQLNLFACSACLSILSFVSYSLCLPLALSTLQGLSCPSLYWCSIYSGPNSNRRSLELDLLCSAYFLLVVFLPQPSHLLAASRDSYPSLYSNVIEPPGTAFLLTYPTSSVCSLDDSTLIISPSFFFFFLNPSSFLLFSFLIQSTSQAI